VKAENLFHTGVVVDDLDALVDWLTKTVGYRWTDVVEVEQVVQTAEEEATLPLRMVISGDEPRVEILQTIPGTIWTPTDSVVHHLGYWSEDVESDLATLEANGAPCEVKAFNPDGSGSLLWAYCKAPTGPRIELVSHAMKPFIEYWFATADSARA
jgi:Glyoxalase/Bleomycin resistance protein/Dioxygenase superfamily